MLFRRIELTYEESGEVMLKRMAVPLVTTALCFACVQVQAAEGKHSLGITIYGQANISVDVLDDGNDSSLYLSSNASRLGFKGDVEINDEWNVVYQCECAVNMDEAGTQFATRATYVGIAGPGGMLIGGHLDTPFKLLGCKNDMFLNRIGDFRNMAGNAGIGFNLRPNNAIAYETPSINGLNGLFLYVPQEGGDKTDLYSANVMYKNDSVLLGVAYESHGKGLTATFDEYGVTTPSEKAESGIRAAATYSVNMIKIMGMYEMLMDVNGVADADRNTFGGGLAVDVGICTVKGQFFTIDGIEGVDNTGATTFVTGVDKKIAKNTTVYLAYAQTQNEDASNLHMTGGGHGDKLAVTNGDDPSGLSLGITHSF
jgi:predicted porin